MDERSGLDESHSARRTFVAVGKGTYSARLSSSISLAQNSSRVLTIGKIADDFRNRARHESRWRFFERVLVQGRDRAVFDFRAKDRARFLVAT